MAIRVCQSNLPYERCFMAYEPLASVSDRIYSGTVNPLPDDWDAAWAYLERRIPTKPAAATPGTGEASTKAAKAKKKIPKKG